MKIRRSGVGFFLLILVILPGCYYLQRPSVPIAVDYYPGELSEQAAKSLLILLPGLGDNQQAFAKRGFIADVKALWPSVDVAAVNGHISYYQNRSIVNRLFEDVIQPARKRGYEKFYFVGISLGGFGALLYERDLMDTLDGIILLAPFLGDEEDYGYVLANQEPNEPIPDDNIWPWLQSLSEDHRQRFYLGYGENDRFAQAHQLLADMLPPDNIAIGPGEHNWRSWQPLWRELLVTIQKN